MYTFFKFYEETLQENRIISADLFCGLWRTICGFLVFCGFICGYFSANISLVDFFFAEMSAAIFFCGFICGVKNSANKISVNISTNKFSQEIPQKNSQTIISAK